MSCAVFYILYKILEIGDLALIRQYSASLRGLHKILSNVSSRYTVTRIGYQRLDSMLQSVTIISVSKRSSRHTVTY